MDEQTITAEERLKQLEDERKTLKVQVRDDRTKRLEEAKLMRAKREVDIEKIQKKVKNISKEIYQYNKMGKVAKVECDILGRIVSEINSYAQKDIVAN